MKIKSLKLKNFKRFTDLTLKDVPETARLVLLIGSNGSGKSSVFDAFELAASTNNLSTKATQIFNYLNYYDYFIKNGDVDAMVDFEFSDGSTFQRVLNKTKGNTASKMISKNSFYGRTSFRQIPVLKRTSLGQQNFNVENDSDRPGVFIDRDERFENDIEIITGFILEEVFKTNKSSEEIRLKYLDPINVAFENIFGNLNGTRLNLISITPPLDGKVADIRFKKGESEFHYNNLSAGEKEVFNVLINLLSRREYYQNSIYFFDEIDLHLNTSLQYSFLKEIVLNWIPKNCQLWTASHSLGFIDFANDNDEACILDFDDLDFDKPQILSPKPKDGLEIFEIAVSKAFIDKVVQGRKIIFSENSDTPFYNDLNIDSTFFFVAIDKNDVFHKAKNHKQFGLIDRDYLSDEELNNINKTYPFLYVLPYYSFENLIYHPDNLEEYYTNAKKIFNKELYIKKLRTIKNEERDYLAAGIIQARAGYPFYKENENAKALKAFKDNYKGVIELLRSDEFEQFYKVFPAKDYGSEILERQNISTPELARTKWFKHQIASTIINKA